MEWHTVTVASLLSIRRAAGFPTRLLRPITAQRLPAMSMPVLFTRCSIPLGVQGIKPLFPVMSAPAFTAWRPSTSLPGEIHDSTRSLSICSGSGSWTNIPCTVSSVFSFFISSITWASATLPSRWCSSVSMPFSLARFSFELTYNLDAGLSPTSTTASLGITPLSRSSRALRFMFSYMLSAISFPSISLAICPPCAACDFSYYIIP